MEISTSTTSQMLQSPAHIKHLKTGIYQGLGDSCEEDSDSDLNCLAPMILRQYNTVINQR